jgi:hypothetical protein
VLEVTYELPAAPERFRVECCLSPDYLALLMRGRRHADQIGGGRRRGWRNGPAAVWLRLPPGQPLVWDVPIQRSCGHGFMLAVAAFAPRFRLQIGTGYSSPGSPP